MTSFYTYICVCVYTYIYIDTHTQIKTNALFGNSQFIWYYTGRAHGLLQIPQHLKVQCHYTQTGTYTVIRQRQREIWGR